MIFLKFISSSTNLFPSKIFILNSFYFFELSYDNKVKSISILLLPSILLVDYYYATSCKAFLLSANFGKERALNFFKTKGFIYYYFFLILSNILFRYSFSSFDIFNCFSFNYLYNTSFFNLEFRMFSYFKYMGFNFSSFSYNTWNSSNFYYKASFGFLSLSLTQLWLFIFFKFSSNVLFYFNISFLLENI